MLPALFGSRLLIRFAHPPRLRPGLIPGLRPPAVGQANRSYTMGHASAGQSRLDGADHASVRHGAGRWHGPALPAGDGRLRGAGPAVAASLGIAGAIG